MLSRLRATICGTSDLLRPKNEKHIAEPLPEKYNASITEHSKEDIDIPPNTPPKLVPRPAGKVATFFILVCWAMFVYVGTIYALNFVVDNTSHVVDNLKWTATKTYGNLVDACDNFKNPRSREEVVEAMTEFYELLAEMGYYDSKLVEKAPHKSGINRTLAEELNYSRDAIEMMDMLPYLNLAEPGEEAWVTDNNEFLLFGEFADLRDEDVLEQCRDPMFATQFENGQPIEGDGYEYMSPNHICLMLLGNHGAIMVLDVKTRKSYLVGRGSRL
jgi:hypothetical protein